MTPVTEKYFDYKQHAFLPDTGYIPSKLFALANDEVGETNVELSATNIWTNIVRRTYEKPNNWYFVVFCPLDKPYDKDPDFFKVKGLDKCRSFFKKPQAYIMTREILDCEKIHVIALVCTTQDLMLHNKKIYCNKYYVDVQLCPLPADRDRVLTYITKEKTKRSPYLKYLDYLNMMR